ncbi:NAD(P)-binding Rossmann-fold superfamily protein [Theobroma cacao]|uniref:NAD(P)-binding Rossmann-fold superfamily protein n=1 Tax=Theobroma cacao TaxID=3641 RepID=A0A061G111_THECC|nr:NAD(P)-binding Rossmann-fold superfamily protein [Theobroma cacao]
MWLFSRKGASGFSATTTAEEATQGIDGTGLTASSQVLLFTLFSPKENNKKEGNPFHSIFSAFWVSSLEYEQEGKERGNTALTYVFGFTSLSLLMFTKIKPYSCFSGGSSGIGTETARVLALRGVHVVVGVRNMTAGRGVKETIVQQNPNAKIDAMELDLSSMASVRKFAADFKSSGLPLNILINNAGIMATSFMLSKDGIELQFATNHMGHFLLTNLLLETMKKTADGSKTEGRIVNVSSRRHKFSYPEGIRFDKINDQSGYNSVSAYGQSKLANVLHANELARRLKEDQVAITANSIHPGVIATNLFRHLSFLSAFILINEQKETIILFSGSVAGLVGLFGKYVIKNVEQGAATTCYVALHPQVKGRTGLYFADCNVAETSVQANDSELAWKLWDFSLSLVNKRPHT